VTDPHALQREADQLLSFVSDDLAAGRPKDAIRLLQTIVDNPLVASLIVRVLDWADHHKPEGRP
jgi:hypothetical protein